MKQNYCLSAAGSRSTTPRLLTGFLKQRLELEEQRIPSMGLPGGPPSDNGGKGREGSWSREERERSWSRREELRLWGRS